MKARFCRLLPALFILQAILHYNSASAQLYSHDYADLDAGPLQGGVKVSWMKPRNDFGMSFNPGPAYEAFLQHRNEDGDGPLLGRISLFYADLKPRLDSLPTYMVTEYPTLALVPGYLSYHKLNFIGVAIEYTYSALQFKRLRLDLGGGLMVGKLHIEYNEGYATVSTSTVSQDQYFAGLRLKAGVSYVLNRYLQVFGEYADALVTQADWDRKFPHDAFGLGLVVTFRPYNDKD